MLSIGDSDFFTTNSWIIYNESFNVKLLFAIFHLSYIMLYN